MTITTLLTARRIASLARSTHGIGVLVVLCSIVYAAGSLHRGWVPHDTGQLGQTAERVLAGEMQHRDFDEPYTGGLGHLHALAFRLFGVRAESIRWTLLAYFSLFMTAVYVLAARVTSAGVAAGVTFLCAALSVPIYSEGMPSWYHLFFATLGTLALLEHLGTGRRRWLFWAGCCAGCCLLMKITGLYFLAAGLIYVAHYEQNLSSADEPRSRGFGVFVTVLCVLFGILALAFTRGTHPLVNAVHFTMPLAAVAGYVAWQEWRIGRGVFRVRMHRLTRQLLPYGLGAAGVVALFLVPYVATGSLHDLYRGLFVLPAERLEHAAIAPPDLKWMCLSLPWAALLLVGACRRASALSRPAILAACIAGLIAIFVWSGSVRGYFFTFQSIRNLIPGVVLVGIMVLFARPRLPHRQAVYLVVTVTALTSLVQYPYAYGTYFFFAVPLMVLAMLYVVASEPHAPKALHAAILAWAICMAVVRIPQPDPRLLNGFYCPDFPTAALHLDRCHFTVYCEDARVYQELVALIQSQTRAGGYIYAAPDCPEVYFLSGTQNPTRTFYDLFERNSGGRRKQVLELVDRYQIDLVVVNHTPGFSGAVDDATLTALRATYPHERVLWASRQPGLPPSARFTVLWRERGGRDERDGRDKTLVTTRRRGGGEL